MAKGGLGGGLGSLFADNASDIQMSRMVRISEIEPNRDQPRKVFRDAGISALAESIREHGVLQPILVRALSTGGYQIVAGERRWRAAKMAGLEEVPVIIKELTELETAQIALIENLQRESLNPMEEANAFWRLQEEFQMTQDEIAKSVGCSRSNITNSVRLLKLPNLLQGMLISNVLSAGHARALLGISDEQRMIELAQKTVADVLSVRQLEKLVAEVKQPRYAGTTVETTTAADRFVSYYQETEEALQTELGRKVRIQRKGRGGDVILSFYDEEDLKSLLNLLFPE